MKGKNRIKRRNQLKKNMMVFVVCSAAMIVMCGVSAVNATEEQHPQRYKYYTTVYVDRDATLWNISKEYMTDEYSDIRAYMDEVKTINHLTDDELQYGTKICVPYYSDEYKV